MKCFYHSSDLDGMCSAAIVRLAYPECELLPINYDDPFPWDSLEPGEVVYMVDFSLPRVDMDRLNRLCELWWMDHHKTALTAMQGFQASGGQLCLDGQAGCELTWQVLFPFLLTPHAVSFLGRHDVWDHSDPNTLRFQYGMRQYDCIPANDAVWQPLLKYENGEERCREIIRIGTILLDYETRSNEMYARTCAFDAELDGLQVVAINKGLCNSLLFKSVYDPERHDAMLSFYRAKGGQWRCSLYSDKPEVDCSAICKARGGGGHRGAAGFICDELPV